MNKQASKSYLTYDDEAPTITLWSLITILLIDYHVFFRFKKVQIQYFWSSTTYYVHYPPQFLHAQSIGNRASRIETESGNNTYIGRGFE